MTPTEKKAALIKTILQVFENYNTLQSLREQKPKLIDLDKTWFKLAFMEIPQLQKMAKELQK